MRWLWRVTPRQQARLASQTCSLASRPRLSSKTRTSESFTCTTTPTASKPQSVSNSLLPLWLTLTNSAKCTQTWGLKMASFRSVSFPIRVRVCVCACVRVCVCACARVRVCVCASCGRARAPPVHILCAGAGLFVGPASAHKLKKFWRLALAPLRYNYIK